MRNNLALLALWARLLHVGHKWSQATSLACLHCHRKFRPVRPERCSYLEITEVSMSKEWSPCHAQGLLWVACL